MATAPTTATAPAPAAAKSPKLLIGVVLAISLAALGVAGYAMTRTQHADSPKEVAAAEKPIFITMEPLTVNLLAEGRPRFLHVGMSLKVRDEKAKAQVMEFMPELRSRALMLMSNRQPDSMMTAEDKTRLAGEIQTELNRPLSEGLPPQAVYGVSFNAFVVQ